MSAASKALIDDVAEVLHGQDLLALSEFVAAAAYSYGVLPAHVREAYEQRAVAVLLVVAPHVERWGA